MRVLLDEHLPHRLRRLFEPEVEVLTVAQLGWKGTRNGALIRAAETDFEVLVTMDQGIPHQQNLDGVKCGIVLLEARSNRYEDLAPPMDSVNDVLKRIQPGEIVRVAK